MIWNDVQPIVATLVDDHDETEWRQMFQKWEGQAWHDGELATERTSILMVDADAVTTDREPDLDALHDLLKDHVQASISDLYLISLFPYVGRASETRVNPRIRLSEDLGRFHHEFGLMYDAEADVYNETQFDVLLETNTLLERLIQGATRVRVHIQSFRGMPEDRIRLVLALWYKVLHYFKLNGQLVLAYEGDASDLASYFDVADAVCRYDLASHVLLAFAQEDTSRLGQWVDHETPPSGKTYFNYLSTPERDPFEKNLIEPSPDQLLAAHSILLSLQGIPAIDYRTLLGVTTSVDRDTLIHELKTDDRRLQVFTGILGQLNVKRTHPAFTPYAPVRVMKSDRRVFAVERTHGTETLTLYTNVSGEVVPLSVAGTNVFTGEPVQDPELKPYAYLWLATT